ncbi:MAG: hypothetical protein AAF738_07350 [Bacteroidota bacterium]
MTNYDLLLKYVLPVLTLLGGWAMSVLNYKNKKRKEENALLLENQEIRIRFQEEIESVYERVHELMRKELIEEQKRNEEKQNFLEQIRQYEARIAELEKR